MPTPTLTLHSQFNAGPIDRRLFSGFLEHMGRSVYEGAYDPASPLSDEHGLRKDVIAALRAMDMPLVRYPGGNFVSTYDWTDGIGPMHKRPRRPDFAWKSIEPNTFGTDEFVRWCGKVGTAPMMAVNLGTHGAQKAGDLVEYCNLKTGTHWADQRAANGHRDPYGIKVWCLGNEMDGPWQAGQVPADEYARRADQAGKVMKGLDPSIELVIAGSSGRGMQTYMEWDRTILEYCWDRVEYISAHRYSGNYQNNSASFLAEGVEIDRILDDYVGLIEYVRGLKRSNKRVQISFDEWNVWYKNREMDGKWTEAPHLIEEVYSFEDALVCGQYMNSFIRHADFVKIACLAQLVNVIGPLLTKRDGLLVQSIYHPFVLLSKHARGVSLKPALNVPTYKAGDRGEVPAIDAAATLDKEKGTLTLSLINRQPGKTHTLDVNFADMAITSVVDAQVMHDRDLKAANTWEKPGRIVFKKASPKVAGGGLTVKLPGPSMTVAVVKIKAR